MEAARPAEKNKNIFAPEPRVRQTLEVVIEFAPLEDELGDVLDKALRLAGLSEATAAERAGLSVEKLRDAVDYRYDLSDDDLRRLASVLQLNFKGLAMLSLGHYPRPNIGGLPLCLYPLRVPHGIGVANSYLVADCCKTAGLLFDAGVDGALTRKVWPKGIRSVEALFLTHAESEHSGGLPELYREMGPFPVFGPSSVRVPGIPVVSLDDGVSVRFGRYQVTVLSTPGHAECHSCYLVSDPALPAAPSLLISGDVLFAGSVGGPHFCRDRLRENVQRLLQTLPPSTVVAPGHGPLTTIEIERAYNSFA